MIVVAITASRVDIMGKLLRSGLADRTNEEGPVGWEDSNFQSNDYQSVAHVVF